MKKRSRARVWVSLFLLAGIVLTAGGFAARWYLFERPLPLKTDRVEFRVAMGSSVRSIAHAAQAAGIALDADAMVAAVRLTGAAQSLRAGRYAVERGITMSGLLAKLRGGDVVREKVTVIEGIAFREMRALLAAQKELMQESARMSDAEILHAIGASDVPSEGVFAPDTYVYDPGTTDIDIYRQAHRAQMKLLHLAWANRATDLPYKSPYEALIMASIIEKETGQASERAMIASVFVNRLRLGMLLQTDPSVIYGIGPAFDGNLRKRDLLADGPYNSYTRVGLPPTPIALPGRASIEAALHPAATPALYFVSRRDGTSQFSATLAEHNRAVDKYQRGAR